MPNRVTLGASRTGLGAAPIPIAADHVIVTPATVNGAPGDTIQLTATVYDAQDTALPGRVVTWSSDTPLIATVSVTGLVTLVGSGIAIITATAEGKSDTATAAVVVPLALTLDFNPFLRRSDLADPRVFVTNTGRTGYQDAVPQHLGAGILGLARASYPKNADEWGFVATVDAPMSQDYVPNLAFFNAGATMFVDGPYPNTAAVSVLPTDAAQHFCALDVRWQPLATADNQDLTTFKRSLACTLMAKTSAGIGKTVRVNLIDQANIPGGWSGSVPVIKYVDVVLQHAYTEHQAAVAAGDWQLAATFWQPVELTFDDATSQNAITLAPQPVVTMAGQIVEYVVAPYEARAWQAEEADASNWLRPLPFHETLGILSADINCNCWNGDSDNPTLYGGAAKVSTAIAAPDSDRYHGGRTLTKFTLNPGDGITSSTIRIEDGGETPPTLSNIPTKGAWFHWYIEPESGHAFPLDTDLAGYLVTAGSGTIAEDTVTRADNLTSPGSMDTGQAWVIVTGQWIVTGNRLQLLNNLGDATMVVDTSQADVTVDATFATVGNDCAVIFRQTNGSNYWRLLWEAGTAFLQKIVSGGVTTVASVALTLANGDRLGVVLSGNSISPTKNGTTVAALVSTDAFNASATKHGLGASNTTQQFSHFKVSGAHTYGPIALKRDPWSVMQRANGGAFYRGRASINQASEGYLDFIPRIVNVSAGQLVFNATRAAVTTEGARGMGVHSAWVPKRTITGRQFSDGCFEVFPNIQKFLTTPTLLWLMRQVVPWSFAELENLNGAGIDGYHPSLWQSGPYGSADFTFHCDVQPFYNGTFTLDVTVARGSPTANPGDFMSWQVRIDNMSIAAAAVSWPAMVAFDMAVAARNGIPVAFGIGLGIGTGVNWLNHGDTFLGGAVSFLHTAGLPWTFDGGGYNDSGHMGIAADLDRVRQTGGFFRALAGANDIEADPAIVKAQIDIFLATWGPRGDFR